MNILIAHELGSGRDGQVRILAISKLLKSSMPDCKIVLSIKKSPEQRHYNSRFIDKIVDSPADLFSTHKDSSMSSYLLNTFFQSTESAALFKKSWAELLYEVKPDLIIADNAPSAVLMANHNRIPVVQMSDGFYHLGNEASEIAGTNVISEMLKTDVGFKKLSFSETLIVNSPLLVPDQGESCHYVHLDSEKDDDGGLPIDIFAYIKKTDPLAQDIISALDEINHKHNKSVMVVMGGIDPVFYKHNFELTPHFVRLQGALCGSPLVIQSFGSGLLLESIKNSCPIWGVPHTKEQANMWNALKQVSSESMSPTSRGGIFESLQAAVLDRTRLENESKRIWNASAKGGITQMTHKFNEIVGELL